MQIGILWYIPSPFFRHAGDAGKATGKSTQSLWICSERSSPVVEWVALSNLSGWRDIHICSMAAPLKARQSICKSSFGEKRS